MEGGRNACVREEGRERQTGEGGQREGMRGAESSKGGEAVGQSEKERGGRKCGKVR